MKLRDLLNEGYSSQTKLQTLTPKIQKLIDGLIKSFSDFNITVADNYKWLRRDDLRGTYTLSISDKSTFGNPINPDKARLKKLNILVKKIQDLSYTEAKNKK